MKSIIVFFLLTFQLVSAQNTDDSWKLYDDSQVDKIEITVDTAALRYMYENVQSDSMHYAQVHFVNKWFDDVIDSVGFRLRGNTSRDAQKKSFKLSFNAFIKGKKYHNVEKLNLNGEHNDPSIVRSKLCWDLFNEVGEVSSRAAHAEVYINGVYYGLYISVEHIDENFVAKNYNDDSGNLWKCLWPADLTYRGPNPEDYYPYIDNERPYELKTNKDLYDYSQLAKLIKIITQTPEPEFADSLESIMVVSDFLKYLAMNTLVGSWDDYRSLMNNYYLYYEPQIDKFHFIPYDYDNTFSIDWFNIDWSNADPYDYPEVNEGDRPLSDRMMQNFQYRNLYSHFMEFFIGNVYKREVFDEHIDSLHTLITPFAEADTFKTKDYGFTNDDFNNSYSASDYSNQHVKKGIKQFIDDRISSLQNQIWYYTTDPIVYKIDYSPKNPLPTDSIIVTVSAYSHSGLQDVEILWSPDLLAITIGYPMTYFPVQDTKNPDEFDMWTGVIPPIGEGGSGSFKIYVRDVNNNELQYPRDGGLRIVSPSPNTSQIELNEIMAKNDTTIADPNGEYDDWVEIFNPSMKAVDLSNLYLTDNPDNLAKWQFPGGTSILPQRYLIVWCDNDIEQSGLHANFKLSAGGEYVGLTSADGVSIIDSVTFPALDADFSYGQLWNIENDWGILWYPTPGEYNEDPDDVNEGNGITKFELSQNYPNPFNPTTIIKYSLPSVAAVKLSVYNVLGREVATLVNKKQTVGNYEINFNVSSKGGELASGVYIYRLSAIGKNVNFMMAKKMLLLR